jgi:hypothetical protein
MGKAAVVIELSGGEQHELEGLAGRRRTAQGLARRARIVLLAAKGLENKEICAEMPERPVVRMLAASLAAHSSGSPSPTAAARRARRCWRHLERADLADTEPGGLRVAKPANIQASAS